jgi:hypothetical protein
MNTRHSCRGSRAGCGAPPSRATRPAGIGAGRHATHWLYHLFSVTNSGQPHFLSHVPTVVFVTLTCRPGILFVTLTCRPGIRRARRSAWVGHFSRPWNAMGPCPVLTRSVRGIELPQHLFLLPAHWTLSLSLSFLGGAREVNDLQLRRVCTASRWATTACTNGGTGASTPPKGGSVEAAGIEPASAAAPV